MQEGERMQKIQLLFVTPEHPTPQEQQAFRQYLQGLLLLSLRDAGIISEAHLTCIEKKRK